MNTITVKKKLFSKIKTIEHAVKQAQPGDTILVEPGHYMENFIIDKPVTIIGNGSRDEVVLSGCFKTEADVTIQHMTITHRANEKVTFGLYVHQGKTSLLDCHFTKMKGFGIYVDNGAVLEAKELQIDKVDIGVELVEGAACVLEDAVVAANVHNGIAIKDKSRGLFNRCVVKENGYPGVYAGGESEVTLQHSTICTNNRGVDIEHAKVTLIDCELYENIETQSYISEKSDVTVRDCHIHTSTAEGYGFYIIDSAVVMENCTIHDHENPQVITTRSTLHMNGCKVFDSATSNGIRLIESSVVEMNDCEVYNHAYIQISVESNSELTIRNSAIYNGQQPALEFEQAKGVVESCDIYQNNDSQLNLSDGSHVVVNQCHIHNPQPDTHGCYATTGSTLIMNDCTIHGHERTQVYADATTLELSRLSIFNGKANGVRLVNASAAVVSECTVYSHRYIQVSVDDESTLSMDDCTIYDGEQTALEFENGKGVVQNCNIYGNNDSQIHLHTGSQVSLSYCHIHQAKPDSYGCYVTTGSRLMMSDCKLEDHENPQVFASEAELALSRTKIFAGLGNGLRLVNKASAVVQHCEVYEHSEHPQISVEDESELMLQFSTIHSSDNAALLFEHGKGVVENCLISENGWRQVYLYEASDVQFRETTVTSTKPETNGIVVSGASNVTIEGCHVSAHTYPQLFIDEKSTFTLTKTTVVEGDDTMALRIIDATGVIEDCEFSHNGERPQLSIETDAEVTLRKCRIHSGEGQAVAVDAAKMTMTDCDIYNHEHVQVEIENNAFADISHCRIFDGRSHGLRFRDGADALVQHVSIYGHTEQFAQVVVKHGSNPTFQHCKIFDGAGDGFLIFDHGFGTIENCTISNHRYANFCIVEGSAPTLRENRIYGGQFGVFAKEANPIIEYCEFESHDYDDIFIDEGCKPMLIGNVLRSVSEPADESAEYEAVLGFNPFTLDEEEVRARLVQENKKWLRRLNAPSLEKRQEAERALQLMEQLEQRLLT